ncbi:Major Facilitator Superfamily protein [Agromyces sp. CF514]|uniref:MFS transporter n=1 Tax=Agromyces sp. CF514 TaxID=1881031 RepID=UPI0008EE138E|nr:MFS transporter [Agromyces sp. CF514]SFR70004.1 Major Facilitator Superfamily protein [Agromyces sp. CF514]
MSPTSSPDTSSLPVIEPDLDAAAASIDEADAAAQASPATQADAAGGGGTAKPGLAARIAASVSDPVLRILVTATLISRVGRGIFLTITVLYFTLVVGLPAHEIAIVLGAASAAGIVASLAGGWLADRMSARRVLLVFTTLEGLGLLCYAVTGDFVSALVVAVIVGAFGQGANSTRMAILARAFEPEQRVHARAVLRTVTNVSIAVGSGLGALALAIGTPEAYRILLVAAGGLYLLALVRLVKLPASVDARPVPPVTGAVGVVAALDGTVDDDLPEADEADAAGGRASQGRRPEASARPTPSTKRRSRFAHSPWRDPRYLALTALSAIFGMQFGVAEIGVPLWIAHETDASAVLVSAVLILNTVIVVLFQVPLSRGTHDLRRAGRVSAIAAWLMAATCLVYAAAAGLPVWFSVVFIVLASITHAFAEVLSQAGGWGLSFELADPVQAGTYQGVYSMGYSIGATLAPAVVTATALSMGLTGWAILAVIFLASGLGTWAIARAAASRADAAAARLAVGGVG